MGEAVTLLHPYKPLFYNPPRKRYYLITGGRGSAKSFHIAVFLLNLTYETGHVILFTRYTMTSAHISIIPEFIEKINLLGLVNDFEITNNEVINNKTGSQILFRGIKNSSGNQTANLKSIHGVTTWVLDEAEELVDESIFDTINLSIRHKTLPNRVILVMNPSNKEHWIYRKFVADSKLYDSERIHTTYLDNIKNLSESFISEAENIRKANLLRYNHLFLGDWIESTEGLLWNHELIELDRVEKPENIVRVVVAIDPAVTAKKDSDETGIIVVAKNDIGHGYVLEDLSGVHTPLEWAKKAIDAATRWEADCIVGEVNNGGDLIEANIRQVSNRIRVKSVRATKGKYVRAEPVYALYERGLVHHVGRFSKLELQMITFNPEQEKKSPDRVDALVWGITELGLGIQQRKRVYSF